MKASTGGYCAYASASHSQFLYKGFFSLLFSPLLLLLFDYFACCVLRLLQYVMY
uniref:Uncharacterized protein n=1 Tax=Anguilla anguilla TaxID=7936 RepID=A0A0E9PRP4_ANGAN